MTVLPRIIQPLPCRKAFVFNCIRNWYQAKGRNLVALIFLVQIAALQLFGARNRGDVNFIRSTEKGWSSVLTLFWRDPTYCPLRRCH